MKKLRKLVVCLLVLSINSSVFAHSGRTDANGGHWDRKTGTYHYHNGGSKSSSSTNKTSSYTTSSSSSKSTTSSASTKNTVIYDSLNLSNISTFINGYEIPTFSRSKNGGAYLLVEDLNNYGFDTDWNGATYTLTVIKNIEKSFNPLPISYYKKFGVGYKFLNVSNSNPVTVVLKNNINDVGYKPYSYNCNGYMAISIDEIKAFTTNWTWDTSSMTMRYVLE